MTTLQTTDNTELNYLIKGSTENPSASTVVFLHGWCANALEWLSVAERLTDRRRVICWNARGHGRVRIAAETDMSLERMADDLEELLAKEAPNNVILLGHSMGALVSWRYIQKYGDQRLSGLCIIDQSPKLLTDASWSFGVYGNFDQARQQDFVGRLGRNFSDTVIRLICSRLDSDPRPVPQSNYVNRLRQYLDNLPAPLMTRCWQSLADADLRDPLGEINLPTLLIYGDKSQFYGPELAHWVADSINNSSLKRYQDADHSPHVSNNQRLVQDLQAFLDHLPRWDTINQSVQYPS